MTFTSIDIFYGVLSVCVLIFTIALVWAIYYIVQILKQGNEVISETRTKIAELEEALTSIKDRVVSSANTITFIAQEIGNIVDVAKSLKGSPRKRRSSRE